MGWWKRRSRSSSYDDSDGEDDTNSFTDTDFQPAYATEEVKRSERYSLSLSLAYKLEQKLSVRRNQYIALVLIGFIQVIVAGLLWTFICMDPDPENPLGFGIAEGIWVAWSYMADPGTHTDDVLLHERILGSMITIGGIVFFAALLGVVVDVIHSTMEAVRQGRSKVVEVGHCLLLGMNCRTTCLINELCIAAASKGGTIIVVLDEKGKESMELKLQEVLPVRQRLGTKVVFRTGSSLLLNDLVNVGADLARTIVVLSSDEAPDLADTAVIRCILVLRSLPRGLSGHIVAEVRDVDNEAMIKWVGGQNCETVCCLDIFGRLMSLAVRQPGLCKVCDALLGFEGDEFYMQEFPSLVGLRFGDLIGRFADAIPIGLMSEGKVYLNPAQSTIIGPKDEIVVIAADDDTYFPQEPPRIEEILSIPGLQEQTKPDNILICGWRQDIRTMFTFLEQSVPPGSEVHCVNDSVSLKMRQEIFDFEEFDESALQNLKVVHEFANTAAPNQMQRVSPGPLGAFTGVIVAADTKHSKDAIQADSHSITTIFVTRDKHGACTSDCPLVCEILDQRSMKIIDQNPSMYNNTEFLLTSKIGAQVMAMLVENRKVKSILEELFGAEGTSISIIHAESLTTAGEEISFWCLAKRASHRRVLLLGYMERNSRDPASLNPPNKNAPMTWEGWDLMALIPPKVCNESPASSRNIPARTAEEVDRQIEMEVERELAQFSECNGAAKEKIKDLVFKAMSPDLEKRSRVHLRTILQMLKDVVQESMHENISDITQVRSMVELVNGTSLKVPQKQKKELPPPRKRGSRITRKTFHTS
mmetsp:Transcript_39297/g.108371  ORF Transcript_39297/g.108371 Transcript_39297/m.108371 type:complete len:814 (+) Transcript_39297:53-2494(+)